MGASSKPNIEGAKTIGKNAISFIDQKRRIGLNDITSFMKNNFSGSCMIGHIAKMPANSLRSNNVDIFLAGLSGNASVGAFGARLGTTVSIDNSDTSFMQKLKNYLTGDQMIGIEFGIGTPGPDFNFGYGVEANKDKTVTGLIRSISK